MVILACSCSVALSSTKDYEYLLLLEDGKLCNSLFLIFSDSLIYSPTCQAHRQGCEVGDLNGKFLETLDMAASPDFNQYFYTDDIPLSGAYSVINRAITIHQAQSAAPRYVCADIKRKVLCLTF